MERQEIESLILDRLDREGQSIKNWISDGFFMELAFDNKLDYKDVCSAFKRLREQVGRGFYYAEAVSINDPRFRQFLGNEGFSRSAPYWERSFCETCKEILRTIPTGGNGMYIGTPTSHSVCINNVNYMDKVYSDNLEVAITIKNTTNDMIIIVGNIEDPRKAKNKVTLWNCSLPGVKVIDAPIDRNSFEQYISDIAKDGELTKIVYMASGCWEGYRNGEWSMKYCFSGVAKSLVKKFPALIIIAMTRSGRSFGFTPLILSGKDNIDSIFKSRFKKYLLF